MSCKAHASSAVKSKSQTWLFKFVYCRSCWLSRRDAYFISRPIFNLMTAQVIRGTSKFYLNLSMMPVVFSLSVFTNEEKEVLKKERLSGPSEIFLLARTMMLTFWSCVRFRELVSVSMTSLARSVTTVVRFNSCRNEITSLQILPYIHYYLKYSNYLLIRSVTSAWITSSINSYGHGSLKPNTYKNSWPFLNCVSKRSFRSLSFELSGYCEFLFSERSCLLFRVPGVIPFNIQFTRDAEVTELG